MLHWGHKWEITVLKYKYEYKMSWIHSSTLEIDAHACIYFLPSCLNWNVVSSHIEVYFHPKIQLYTHHSSFFHSSERCLQYLKVGGGQQEFLLPQCIDVRWGYLSSLLHPCISLSSAGAFKLSQQSKERQRGGAWLASKNVLIAAVISRRLPGSLPRRL